MRRFFSLVTLMAAAVTISSCAKSLVDDTDDRRKITFETWISLYAPNAVKDQSGIYIEKIDDTPILGAVRAKNEEWVRINYTMRNMITGDIFATRDKATAEQIGTYKSYTHYAPQMERRSASADAPMIMGIYYALETMREGEVWRLYLPSEYGYHSVGSEGEYPFVWGYGAPKEQQVSPNTPLIVDLELVEVVPDPEAYEVEQIRTYATSVMGKSLADTIAHNVYYRTLSTGLDTMHVKYSNPNDTNIVVKYRYAGYTLDDDFMFDTNMSEVAEATGQFRPGQSYGLTATRLWATRTSNNDQIDGIDIVAVIEGMYDALYNMKMGETGEVVIPSAKAYGSSGSYPTVVTGTNGTEAASAGTIIDPYSPLRFIIQAAPSEGNGTKAFPYTPAGVRRDMAVLPPHQYWIEGYVVGSASAASGWNIGKTATTDEAILISRNKSETLEDNCIAVELTAGPIRDALNLMTNVKRYDTKIAVKADMQTYLGAPGAVNISEYIVY